MGCPWRCSHSCRLPLECVPSRMLRGRGSSADVSKQAGRLLLGGPVLQVVTGIGCGDPDPEPPSCGGSCRLQTLRRERAGLWAASEAPCVLQVSVTDLCPAGPLQAVEIQLESSSLANMCRAHHAVVGRLQVWQLSLACAGSLRGVVGTMVACGYVPRVAAEQCVVGRCVGMGPAWFPAACEYMWPVGRRETSTRPLCSGRRSEPGPGQPPPSPPGRACGLGCAEGSAATASTRSHAFPYAWSLHRPPAPGSQRSCT